jgi:hypothetical protein
LIRTVEQQVNPVVLAKAGFECLTHEFVEVESPLVRQFLLTEGAEPSEQQLDQFATAQTAFYRSWTEHTLRGALDGVAGGASAAASSLPSLRTACEKDQLVDAFYAKLRDLIRANTHIWRRKPNRFYVFAALRKI